MNNIAKIKEITNNRIYLCHLKDFDFKENTERKFWNTRDVVFEGTNPKNLLLSKGDTVEFFIPPIRTIGASFLMLIFPILVLIFTYSILSLFKGIPDPVKAMASLATLFLSFFSTKLLKKLGIKETMPVITKKLESQDIDAYKSQCKDCGSCTACN